MEGKRLIQTLRMRNLLSYGDQGQEIGLEPLNVLIGPNASGKSNLIEAIGLLRATPSDLTASIRAGGGISEWLWKGAKSTPIADEDTFMLPIDSHLAPCYDPTPTIIPNRRRSCA